MGHLTTDCSKCVLKSSKKNRRLYIHSRKWVAEFFNNKNEILLQPPDEVVFVEKRSDLVHLTWDALDDDQCQSIITTLNDCGQIFIAFKGCSNEKKGVSIISYYGHLRSHPSCSHCGEGLIVQLSDLLDYKFKTILLKLEDFFYYRECALADIQDRPVSLNQIARCDYLLNLRRSRAFESFEDDI
ncbi:hypothetical protein [Desulfobacula toluolica]|uniref:hypothetical protein n=1 Tax=Desulfobacula toluolica TaxID=28223 RepID=UPI00059D15BA|nr:hypothetical protein [Desulfobacula toluolica]